ncbi:MAG: PAS domain S-box protein [Deltaproteobacteria bacterium]|nr:PAS domain S-box protein [Deltaproteobacteria bacterium]
MPASRKRSQHDPVRVLLVEDNRADYLFTRALLNAIEEGTYQLDWVSTFAEGARELARGTHDIYLLDYRLDDGNGLDLLKQAIDGGCRKPMILLTAYGDDDIDLQAIRAGAADYMMKGEFDSRLLERAIRYAIGRAETAEALRLSEERYSLAAHGATDAIWDWDLKAKQLYLSPRWKTMFGLSTEDGKMGDASEWFSRVHVADRKAISNAVRRHLKGETPHFEFEFRLRHEEGGYRWVTARGLAVRDRNGWTTRMAGSVTDTTERTVQHHQLRAILASMVEGVVAVDGDARVMHINTVGSEMLGTAGKRIQGQAISTASQLIEADRMLRRTLDEGRSLRSEAFVSVEGSDRVYELRSAPLRPVEDELLPGAVMVMHDITELRRLEQLQREFVANVSHELQTPLAAVLGMVDTLIDDDEMDPAKKQSYLQRIGAQSTRLSTLVSDLLTLSRAESREHRAERRDVDLAQIGADSARMLSPRFKGKQLAFKVVLPDSPLMVEGTEELLRQVVDNLLTNALKYTPEGGQVWLRLQAHNAQALLWLRLQAHNAQALLEVEDTGLGIAPEHQGRIFERFYRVDKARSRAAGGTGLGLAIIKHAVLSLEGHVSVESTPGRGSTFRIRLPLRELSGPHRPAKQVSP